MRTYFVHDDLNLTVKAYYNCDEAERNTHQWCRVQQVTTRPTVLEAYAWASDNEKLCDLYKQILRPACEKLAS